MHPSEAA